MVPLPPRQPLFQVGRRKLAEIALRSGHDQVEPPHQFHRRQLRPVELDSDEAREVAKILREDEALPQHDNRHRLGAEVRELLHRLWPSANVDRLVGDPACGQELLGPEAARAPRLPVHLEIICHHGPPRRAATARAYSAV